MGFLLGMCGKLFAGRRVRQLQGEMMRKQSEIRRATREAANMEKQINSYQRNESNRLKMENSLFTYGLQQTSMNGLAKEQAEINKYMSNGVVKPDLTDEQKEAYKLALQAYQMKSVELNSSMSSMQQYSQMSLSQAQTQLENEVEMMKELQLEPLKEYEQELQAEKETLESEIQLAQQDYEACKEMEKAGAKNLAPQYTGQG